MNTSAQTQLIKDFEQHYQYDATYLHELLQHSPAGYEKFVAFRPLSQHREQLSPETYWVAKIAAMQVADCGNCLQLIVRMALEAGVAREWVLATLQGKVAANCRSRCRIFTISPPAWRRIAMSIRCCKNASSAS